MNEADVKRKLVHRMREEGGYARRFEDKWAVGLPDMMLIPKGGPVVWAEVKMITDWKFGPSPRQHEELQRLELPPHCRGLVFGWKHGVLYGTRPTQMQFDIRKCLELDPIEGLSSFIRRILNGNNTQRSEGSP